MPAKTALSVSLTPELAQFIANKVASGHYGSSSEVVRAGLRLLAEKEGWSPHQDGNTRRGPTVLAENGRNGR